MSELTEEQEQLAEYLKRHASGADNALKNAVIAEALGYTDRGSAGRAGIRNSRKLTADINALRAAGFPICADHTGIFYAVYQEEILPTLKDYEHRAAVFASQAAALRSAGNALPVAA
jgi:hypothetical protein